VNAGLIGCSQQSVFRQLRFQSASGPAAPSNTCSAACDACAA
jgi:hypothetical protein